MTNCLRLVIALLVTASFTQCKTTRLSSQAYEWMPYKGGEVLVFSSNENDVDTLFLLEVHTSTSGRGEMGMDANYESLSVEYRHTEHYDDQDTAGFGWDSFVSIIARGNGDVLNVGLQAKRAFFYSTQPDPLIKSLNDVEPKTVSTRYGDYDDVYIFEPTKEDLSEYYEHNKNVYVKKLYWSKSEGLVRYDKLNGEIWELKKKYIPKKPHRFSHSGY
jgi:hypothetical protein